MPFIEAEAAAGAVGVDENPVRGQVLRKIEGNLGGAVGAEQGGMPEQGVLEVEPSPCLGHAISVLPEILIGQILDIGVILLGAADSARAARRIRFRLGSR